MAEQTDNKEKSVIEAYPDEVKHLQGIELLIGKELETADKKIAHLIDVFEKTKQERKDNYYDMDGREHIAMDRALHEMDQSAGLAAKEKDHLLKLQDSPYFARFDFTEEGHENEAFYIGRFGFEQDHDLLIYDWRAPVSSMFYDWETGPASYKAPIGTIRGTMTLKRQYQIRKGELQFVVDSSETVSDDVLQQELSKTSDEKMKTIISTIQHAQNLIIRNESRKTMVIQGVAGSGKTSVALHRIAFLLYRFKDSIKAENVMILSPNKAFADYISGVIPELGEEPITESSFYEIAVDLLDNVIDFEDEINPYDVDDEDWKKRARFKSSPEFLNALLKYTEEMPERIFVPNDYHYEGKTIEKEWIRDTFLFYKTDSLMGRLPEVADDILDELRVRLGLRFDLPKQGRVIERLRGMVKIKSPAALYRDFFRVNGWMHMLNLQHNKLEWPDVYPFLLLWDSYMGLGKHLYVRHLVVDEMQDYTPVQYEVLNRMYPCQKTILGDFGQAMNPCRDYTLSDLLGRFPDAEFTEMNKSFRSTKEIMQYACRVSPQDNLEPIDRHGEEPALKIFETRDEELRAVRELIDSYRKSGMNSLGIILKTNRGAAAFYDLIAADAPDVALIRPDSKEYKGGISVMSIQMAKGLEFDEVIVPDADSENFSDETDRSLLYVACTRAMHKLTLTAVGIPSLFLPKE